MFTRLRTAASGIALGAGLWALPAAAQADSEPLARFEDPLCPGVAGLKLDAAELMVGRIRANADELGLRLAEEAVCKPNLVVSFVADGQGFFEKVRAERAYLFTNLTPGERDELLGEGRPVRTLLRVIPRSRDGMPINRRDDLVVPPQTSMWMAHSKIYTPTRNDIYHALVVFDRNAVEGMTLDQLADYATFRALTRALPRLEAAADGSILALFSDDSPPAGLTASDRAWLAELYRGPPNMPASTRLAELETASGRRAAARE